MTTYTCTICERVFSRRSSLRNHVRTHDNILIDRVLREISEDREENPVFSDDEDNDPVFSDDEYDDPELTGDNQREEEQEFEQGENFEEEEEQEENSEEEEQLEEEKQPEKKDGSSSHSSLSLNGEEQKEAEAEEAVVIISYFIYTSLKSVDHLIYSCIRIYR